MTRLCQVLCEMDSDVGRFKRRQYVNEPYAPVKMAGHALRRYGWFVGNARKGSRSGR